jgi:peptidoglycan/LPS O-acetylase OafA/YrhL
MINEYHTVSCISDMVVGAFGAWLILNFTWFKEKIVNLKKRTIFLVYLSGFIVFFFRSDLLFCNQYILIFERLIISIIFLLVILEQNYSINSFFKLGNLGVVSNLGKVTYGLYCLHFIGILVALKLTSLMGLNSNIWQVIFIETPLSLVISILIAKISFKFFELPFLKLKKLFQTN